MQKRPKYVQKRSTDPDWHIKYHIYIESTKLLKLQLNLYMDLFLVRGDCWKPVLYWKSHLADI